MPSARHTPVSVTYKLFYDKLIFFTFLEQANRSGRQNKRHPDNSGNACDRGAAAALSVFTVRTVCTRSALRGLTRIDAVDKPIAVFADIGHVLRPGGRLAVTGNYESNRIVNLRRLGRRAAFISNVVILPPPPLLVFVAVISTTTV